MSTMNNAVTWFEIGTSDPAAASAFYGGLFGWKFSSDKEYSEIDPSAEGGIAGGIMPLGGGATGYAIFYVQVADVPAAVAAAEAAGGKLAVGPKGDPDGLTFAHLLDPAGNRFGVFTPPAAS
ncbi:VOC family protein [Rugosimonospora acidiphila]|uniref:VOC family protein n=1 Tax=Rugosimonospora acidiphila TaxID=556531 RepID=A0ABP9RRE3_9ACTN